MTSGPELKEENRFVEEAAIQLDCWAIKFKHEKVKGGPDRIILIKNRKPIFIEFKRPDGKGIVSPHQIEYMAQIEDFGYSCYVCETWQEAIKVLKEYIKGK